MTQRLYIFSRLKTLCRHRFSNIFSATLRSNINEIMFEDLSDTNESYGNGGSVTNSMRVGWDMGTKSFRV